MAVKFLAHFPNLFPRVLELCRASVPGGEVFLRAAHLQLLGMGFRW